MTQWHNAARTTRGTYHYARPALGGGVAQANFFADQSLKLGFKPGTDLWQLDAEDGLNSGVGNWGDYINAFMSTATQRLGVRGFLYAGWYFVTGHGLQAHIAKYKWWLPAYGSNDGGVHSFPQGVPSNLVVIHQFTSKGNLDQNRVVDQARYSEGSTPPPVPWKVQPMYNPPLSVAAVLKDPAGHVVGGVSPDGHIFAWGIPFNHDNPSKSQPFGNSYWAGRQAATLEWPNDKEKAAGRHYTVIATSGERYSFT